MRRADHAPNGAGVTLNDVAAHAGVSRATASLVLRQTGRVSEATRERVRASMSALGYVPDRGAAALRNHTSNTVGVVVTNLANPFFGELLHGLEKSLAAAGFACLLVDTSDDPDAQDAAVRELRGHKVAGLAIVPATGTTAEFPASLQELGLPFVFMTRYLPGTPAPYVGADDVLGGNLAARHMIDVHNATTIAYVGGPIGMLSRENRIGGVKRAMADAGIAATSLHEFPSETSGAGGLQAGRELIDSGLRPDVIICHSDSVAFGVYRALRLHGLADDIAVTGYDDVATAALWEPPLTSISTHGTELGHRAAAHLLEQLAGGNPQLVQRTTPEIAVRQSCGCPAQSIG
ncbi:LacI family transcriptional regulator [Microbacterium sp. LWH7-1.2]